MLVLSFGVIGIGYWSSNTILNTMSKQLISHMTVSINGHVQIMMNVPTRMLTRVQNSVARHQVALDDPHALAAELYGLLRDEPDVDWLYFANEAGGLVSTGRLDDGTQVILMNDNFRAGVLRQYNASPTGRITTLRKPGDYFDPRQRDWYRMAKETRNPFLTKPYIGVSEPILGLSISTPVVGKAGELLGVYGLDLILTRLSDFMDLQRLGDTGRAYLADDDGYLIASSGGVPPVVVDPEGRQRRLRPEDAQDPVVRAVARYLSQHPDIVATSRLSGMQSFVFKDATLGRISAAVDFFHLSYGSPWLIVSALPASDFIGAVRDAGYLSLALAAALVCSSLAVGLWTVARALRPLYSLTAAAHAIGGGGWPEVPETHRNDEIGVLARALDQMTRSLRKAQEELEQKVVDLQQENTSRRRAEGAVRESQRLLQSIIDNSTALIYVKDLEGRYVLANRRVEELFRIVPGVTDHELFSREQADAYRAVDRQVAASGAALQTEEEAPLADGVRTYISIKAPLYDSSGRVYAVCGVSTDITERKRAERHQAAQFAVAGVLAGSATLAEAAPCLLQILCESLGWELGEIWIIDARADLVRHMESWHMPALEADKFIARSRGAAFPRGIGLPGRVWRSGEPKWVADVTNDPGCVRAALAAETGLHGSFAFPIMLGSQMLGVMAFFSRQMRQPDAVLLAMLATIGSQIGQFVERKRAEEELRFSEQRYRALHRDNPTMIFTLDTEGTILSVNPFGANQLGFTIDELEGQPVLNVFHADDRPAVVEQLQKCLQNPNQVSRWHFRKIRKDGALLWVEELAQAVYGPEGALNVLVVCQDITERRRAEEARVQALAEAEAARDKIDAILKSVADGLVVTDLADQVILMNEAAEALLGIDLAGTSRRHIDSLLAEEPLRRQIAEVRRGEQEKALTELERRTTGYGRTRVLQAQTTAVRSAEGQLTGTITILRDITREREIDRMKNEFISTAAHELRTPLTTVMGYLELLLQRSQEFTPEERKEFVELIYRNSQALARIISDLLDLSRVQAGRLVTLEKVRADLAAQVRGVMAAYQGISERHRFQLEFPEEPVVICFDSGKIGQVLDNLLSNAVKFSPAGGTVRVIGRRAGDEFQITVADEGIGMRPEEVARIFDKFYRADASNTAVSGLGLGMSIVRNIVAAHGGRIWVESAPGHGTSVHFTLPAEDRAAECERVFN